MTARHAPQLWKLAQRVRIGYARTRAHHLKYIYTPFPPEMSALMFHETSDTRAREIVCPYCRAQVGQPCVGHRGAFRDTCHRERFDALERPTDTPRREPLPSSGRSDHRLDAETIARGKAGVAEAKRLLTPYVAWEVKHGRPAFPGRSAIDDELAARRRRHG